MAGLRSKGIRTTGGAFSGSGRSRTGEGIAAALGAIGGGISRSRDRRAREEEAAANRAFRAEENEKDRQFRSSEREKDRRMSVVKMLAGESKAAQARLEAAQQEHGNLKALEQEFVSRGQEVPEQIQRQVQESEQGVGALIGKFRSLLGKITGAGGNPEAVANRIENPVEIARASAGLDAQIRSDEDALRRIPKKFTSRKAREQAGQLRDRIRRRLLENKKDKAELEVRGEGAMLSRRRRDEEEQRRANEVMNRRQIMDYGESLGIPENELRGFIQRTDHTRTSLGDTRNDMEAWVRSRDRAQEDASESAAEEDAIAQHRLDFEKMVPDGIDPAARKEMETLISDGKAAQAFKRLAQVKDDMRAASQERNERPIKAGSGGVSQAMKPKKDAFGTEQEPDLSGVSEEAIAADLGDRKKSVAWAKQVLETKYKVSKMSRREKAALGLRLTQMRPAEEQEAYAHRLKEALGL